MVLLDKEYYASLLFVVSWCFMLGIMHESWRSDQFVSPRPRCRRRHVLLNILINSIEANNCSFH